MLVVFMVYLLLMCAVCGVEGQAVSAAEGRKEKAEWVGLQSEQQTREEGTWQRHLWLSKTNLA